MSSGGTSHSKGHIFNEWGDCLNHHQVYEMCQELIWLQSDWLIDHIAHLLHSNSSEQHVAKSAEVSLMSRDSTVWIWKQSLTWKKQTVAFRIGNICIGTEKKSRVVDISHYYADM